MLQQTQVSRVFARYTEFIEAWPNVQTLANASVADVLRVWKGMGYNRRALYLHRMAKIVVEKHNSKFPVSEQQLSKLPGLGKYTACAVLVFAYNKNVACVDTNIRQIITHYFFHDQPQKESIVENVADQLIPHGKSWEWHQALMDYGALRFRPSTSSGLRSGQARKRLESGRRTSPVPFRDSDRFIRGRIMDALRVRTYERKALIAEISDTYQKPFGRVNGLIDILKNEGLLALRGNRVMLPD